MTDHDHKTRVLIVHDEVFQPVDGVDVEVVRRLVEHDDVGFAEQRLRKQDLYLHAPVGVCHQVAVHRNRNAQALQQAAGVRLGLPAVHLGKLRFEFARAHPVLLGKVRLFIQRVLFLHHVVQTLIAHNDGVKDGILVVLELVLFQDRHPRLGREGDRTGGRL